MYEQHLEAYRYMHTHICNPWKLICIYACPCICTAIFVYRWMFAHIRVSPQAARLGTFARRGHHYFADRRPQRHRRLAAGPCRCGHASPTLPHCLRCCPLTLAARGAWTERIDSRMPVRMSDAEFVDMFFNLDAINFAAVGLAHIRLVVAVSEWFSPAPECSRRSLTTPQPSHFQPQALQSNGRHGWHSGEVPLAIRVCMPGASGGPQSPSVGPVRGPPAAQLPQKVQPSCRRRCSPTTAAPPSSHAAATQRRNCFSRK